MEISIKKFSPGDGDQTLRIELSPLRFESSKQLGPFGRRSLIGEPTDVSNTQGQWTYRSYENETLVATVLGKPPAWNGEGSDDLNEIFRTLAKPDKDELAGGFRYHAASRAIQKEQPDLAWIELNRGLDLCSPERHHSTHPLSAALGKKEGKTQALTKKSTPEETRGWVDLCLAHGASLHHRLVLDNGKPGSTLGELAMIYDPEASRDLCAEGGVDLTALLNKRFENLAYDDADSPSLLCWALSTGDDRWLSQVKNAQTLWDREKPHYWTAIERVCKDAMLKGDVIPLIAAASMEVSDFRKAEVFLHGAAEWFNSHRFDPCRLKNGKNSFNKGLSKLLACQETLGLHGVIEKSWVMGVLEASLGTAQASDDLQSDFAIKGLDQDKIFERIAEVKTTDPKFALSELGEFELKMLMATGSTASEIAKIIESWSPDGERALALALERESAFELSRQLHSQIVSPTKKRTMSSL